MSESLIVVLGIITSAICGGLIVYYWLKDTIKDLEQKVQFWSDKTKQKTELIETLNNELDRYDEILIKLESELEKYKTRRAKIKFTEQQNKEIISMRKRGYSFRVIASKLGISRETIRIHFNELMEKQ